MQGYQCNVMNAILWIQCYSYECNVIVMNAMLWMQSYECNVMNAMLWMQFNECKEMTVLLMLSIAIVAGRDLAIF